MWHWLSLYAINEKPQVWIIVHCCVLSLPNKKQVFSLGSNSPPLFIRIYYPSPKKPLQFIYVLPGNFMLWLIYYTWHISPIQNKE